MLKVLEKFWLCIICISVAGSVGVTIYNRRFTTDTFMLIGVAVLAGFQYFVRRKQRIADEKKMVK
jgi:hypothetical protein